MNIVVISDIHVAKKWDELNHTLTGDVDYLNSNENLRKVILSSNPKNDLIIFNGDLVDYYYTDYLNWRDSNWDIFFDIISRFKGEHYFNLGNHDYRKIPYNFSLYGLKHVNISDHTRRRYKNRIGFNRFRYLKEIDSLSVNLNKFNPIPSKIINSKKIIYITHSTLLLLNTGPDALTHFVDILNPKNWFPCASSGLANQEMTLLKNQLDKNDEKELILFLHCPPFFAKNKVSKIKLSLENYSLLLIKNGLGYRTFSKNNKGFINAILRSQRNVTIITSHVHIPKQYVIDKETRILKESTIDEINSLRYQSRYIKFISILPLGAIKPPYNYKVGYLKISKDKIEHIVVRDYNKPEFCGAVMDSE